MTMDRRLEGYRRVLFVAYQRYLAADRALQIAQAGALRWFPNARTRGTALIGNPGSRIRLLYERRDRAIARLQLSREALERAEAQFRNRSRSKVLLIDIGK